MTKNLGKKFVFHIMDVWTGPKFCPSRSVRVGCDIQTDLTLVLSGSPGWFLGPEFHVRCSNKVQTVLVLNTGFGNLWSQKKYFFKFSELGTEDTSSFIEDMQYDSYVMKSQDLELSVEGKISSLLVERVLSSIWAKRVG